MNMRLYHVAFPILLACTSQSYAATVTAANCESGHLKAAAKMCQQVLSCESAYLKKPIADPVGSGLEACESKALLGFDVTYANLITTTSASSVSCPQEQDGLFIRDRLRADLKNLREYLSAGWDSDNPLSNTLYSGIFKTEAVYCNKLLNAQAKDVLNHNGTTLGEAEVAAGAALQSKVDSLVIAAQGDGLNYSGSAEDDLGAGLHTAQSLASTLAGNLAPRRLATGAIHTCALLDNGSVKCWGRNNVGQLGLGDTNSRGDDPNEMGNNLSRVNLGTGRTATQVTAGADFTCALLDDGSVKCWGYNSAGQLGLGDINYRGDGPNEMGDNLPAVNLGTGLKARQIAAGQFHTCALLDNGSVKCWGYNGSGQLGQGNTNYWGDGTGLMGDGLPPINLGNGRTARQIETGGEHTCALLDNGDVKCWGSNQYGQLGQGNTNNQGDNAGEMANLAKVDLGSGRTALQISAGYDYVCALLDDNSMKCWGKNGNGQLGLGNLSDKGDAGGEMGNSLPKLDLGTGRTVQQIAAGDYHTCALLVDSSVKCWGLNGSGRLGLGDTVQRGDGAGEMGDNLATVDLGAAGPQCKSQLVTARHAFYWMTAALNVGEPMNTANSAWATTLLLTSRRTAAMPPMKWDSICRRWI